MKKYINKYKKINTKISLKKANKKERIPKKTTISKYA